MSRTTRIRIAVATGATVLCAGASVPAIAHGLDSDGSGSAVAAHHRLSFAEQQARALSLLTHESEWLTSLKQKVAADDRLTADQKAAFTSKLDDALAQVAAAQTAVQNATTRAELRAALGRAELPYLSYPDYVLPSLAELKADVEQMIAAREARLTDLRDRVAADARLTDAQKSAFTAKIDKALADLARASDAVAAATTREQVREAVAAISHWRGHYPRHHWMHHRNHHRSDPATVKPVSATVRHSDRSLLVARRIDSHNCDGYWKHDRKWDGHRRTHHHR